MQVGSLYLANAFYKNNKVLIKEDATIPNQSEVVLTYFNVGKEPVNAQVSFPSLKNLPQKIVKKIEPGHKRKFVFIVTSDCKLKNFLIELVDLKEASKKREREEIRELKGKEKELVPSSKKQHLENEGRDESNCELTTDETTDEEEKEAPPKKINLGFIIYDYTEKKRIPWEYSEKNSVYVTLPSDHELGFHMQNDNLKKQRVLCNLSYGNQIFQVNGQNIADLEYKQPIRLFTYTPKKEQSSLLITCLTTNWPALPGQQCYIVNIPARIV